VIGLPTFARAFGNPIDRQNRAHEEAQLPEMSSDDQTLDDVHKAWVYAINVDY